MPGAQPPSFNDSAAFVHRLRARLSRDPGFAARLRRAAGTPIHDADRVLVDWYGFVESAPGSLGSGRALPVAFLVATMFAHDRKAYRAVPAQDTGDETDIEGLPQAGESDRRGNFGASLGGLATSPKLEEDPMARRLAILLDSDLGAEGHGTLPWRLRRLATFVLQKGGCIDWPRLLVDLQRWNDPQRAVQREWARAYFRIASDMLPPADTQVAVSPASIS